MFANAIVMWYRCNICGSKGSCLHHSHALSKFSCDVNHLVQDIEIKQPEKFFDWSLLKFNSRASIMRLCANYEMRIAQNEVCKLNYGCDIGLNEMAASCYGLLITEKDM